VRDPHLALGTDLPLRGVHHPRLDLVFGVVARGVGLEAEHGVSLGIGLQHLAADIPVAPRKASTDFRVLALVEPGILVVPGKPGMPGRLADPKFDVGVGHRPAVEVLGGDVDFHGLAEAEGATLGHASAGFLGGADLHRELRELVLLEAEEGRIA
jgi:hypothetical protein